jgi:membrane protein
MMATRSERNGQRGRAPDSPNKLPKSAWRSALKRTISEFSADNLTDYAAALTYYGIVALFPALIALVSILGLVGQSATKPLLDNLGGFAPGPAHQILQNALDGLTQSRGGAGILLVVGLGGALWSASGYIGAFIRASNIIWDVEEGRPIWRTLPLRLVITVTMIVLLAISAIAVVVTGPLADRVGKLLGVGSTFVTVWDVAKWPVLVVVVSFMFSILYYASPNVRQPGFRWVTPGGVLAVISWIVVSAAFGIYVANFGSYNKTYGTLGGVIIFLVWLWITNLAVLLGLEFDAELVRQRAVAGGHPADHEPYVQPRDTRKWDEEDRRRLGP